MPEFLLGIWYFVYIVIEDNKIGADTYNRWCPPRGRDKRTYTGTIGEDSNLKIVATRLK